ncbi:MAG: hypothetical protein HY905_20070 [Deltaproteobacteria bacterium]|nr:hypothetical protein [Deltaproteobacteria bacterium]
MSCLCRPGADADVDGDAGGEEDATDEADAGGDRSDGDGGSGADADAADADARPDGGSCNVVDLPEQTMCNAGFRCTVGSISAGEAVPVCDPEGTGANNDSCVRPTPDGTVDDCSRAYYCLRIDGATRCHRFCATNRDCSDAAGSTFAGCYFSLPDGAGGTVPGVRFCTTGCDPAADSGCSAGQACRPSGNASGLYGDCSPAGTGRQGADCTEDGDAACAPHYTCLRATEGNACYRFCSTDLDCSSDVGANSQCVLTVSTGGERIPGYVVCSESCDPLADSVCPAMGETCRTWTYTGHTGAASYCGAVGAGGQNAACPGGGDECQAGFDCWNVTDYGEICLGYCRMDGGSPSCGSGTSCVSAGSEYPAELGVCLP